MKATDSMTAYCAVSPGVIKPVTVKIPEPDDYEVLVKNEGCVFCNNTDKLVVNQHFGSKDFPVLFGHEDFGRVVKVGKKVRRFKLGDRVICANAVVNGFDGTYHSSWGGFAEYGIVGDIEAYLEEHGSVDEKNAYRNRYAANFVIPSDFSYEKASLVFPLAEAASAVLQAGEIKGKNIAVIGTGIAGYFFTYFAKTYGAERVICLGRRKERLEIAAKLGADAVFTDISEAESCLKPFGGADIVFECSGNPNVFENGIPYLRCGGTLAVYAVPSKPYEIDFRKMPQSINFRRVGPKVGDALELVCDCLRNDKVPVDLILTHKWKFEEVPEAYEKVVSGEVIKGLVVIS